MHTFFIALILLLNYLSPPKVHALTNPLGVSNNHFGIHIIDESDLPTAASLVNSQGGDWGYVTLVIRQDDRDPQKWQGIFNQMRELHLIPLLRLATIPEGDYWQKPSLAEAEAWAVFLNSLHWVIQNRYLILFNEPNHAKEWGQDLKPSEYAQVVKTYTTAFKKASPDFFILSAGFDLAAPTGTDTMDAFQYFKFMHAQDPDIFTRFDGWASHSYPNPGFVGRPQDVSRQSISGYKQERQILTSLGLPAGLPLFITETGWLHHANGSENKALDPDTVAVYYRHAFNSIWTDPYLVAITPFVLKYLDQPFLQFSWLEAQSQQPTAIFDAVQAMTKKPGAPVQTRNAKFAQASLPRELVTGSLYQIALPIQNTGQSIWTPLKDNVKIISQLVSPSPLSLPISQTIPFSTFSLHFTVSTPLIIGQYPLEMSLSHLDNPFGEPLSHTISVIAPPNLYVNATVGFNATYTGSDMNLLIYDHETLIQKFENISFAAGQAFIPRLINIIPGKMYRLVLTKPFVLPATVYAPLHKKSTEVTFTRTLPLDGDNNGALNLKDVWESVFHPARTFKLWFSS